MCRTGLHLLNAKRGRAVDPFFHRILGLKMAFRLVGFILILDLGLLGCATPPAPRADTTPSASQQMEKPLEELLGGTIGPGDVLEVIVRRGAGEERYTPTVKEDGTVPVLSVDVSVKGLTLGQAAARIEAALAELIREPKVQVIVKQKAITTQKILVLGEVKKQGVYPLSPGFTVLQAIAGADSYTDTAILEDVRIIRGGLAQPVILSSNIERLLKQGDLSQNLLLQDNDIVYLPRQKIGDWNAFLAKIKPTLEVLVGFPLNTIFQIAVISDAIK